MSEKVLITGCSSGFGELTASTMANAGATVVATMRDPEDRNAEPAERLRRAAEAGPGSLQVLELDVTDDASVEAAVARAEQLTGGLDVVVNNAGIGGGGHVEGYTVDQFKAMFEVNLFGVQRVNRAALPAMRERGSGLLVHVSSILGRVIMPFCGPYNPTKYALEALAESYRYELAGTGVDSVIVEPGGFATDMGSRVMMPEDEERVASYGELAELPKKMWGSFVETLQGENGPAPQLVADAILELVRTPAGRRPLRTVVDPLMGGAGAVTLNEASVGVQAELLANLGMASMAGS
jgi:NAD(P)-dependent dehydrogenase (short-subunit alcohol dehydrogenase family)